MKTDIDLVFDQIHAPLDTFPRGMPAGQPWPIPRSPLSLLLEAGMRRRARFLDSGEAGPPERWPYVTPAHLIEELTDLARQLKKLSGLKHSQALDRVARAAGYWSWEHTRTEGAKFEALTGEAFRTGLVVAADHIRGPGVGFTLDQGLIFLAARDLVSEYSSIDSEGGWCQLVGPSTIGGRELNFRATRQKFLEAVGASYWRADNGVARFLRYDGPTPTDFDAALELARVQLGADAVNYLWLGGQMHTIRPLWD